MKQKSPSNPAKSTPYNAKNTNVLPFAHHFLPDLDVLIITYNHEELLKECVESVLAQQTTYTYRIHILDDKSTDNTSEIAANYAKQYPDRIIHHCHPINLGPTQNATFGFAQAHGRYVTMIEGDDYWCAPEKIQTMLEFLDKNEQYVGMVHDTLRTSDNSSVPEAKKEIYTFEDFATGNAHFHLSGTMWRNIYRGGFPFHHNELVGDIFTLMLYSSHGDVYYLDKPWSYYRVHEAGAFQGENPAKIKRHYTLTVQAMQLFQKYFHSGKAYKLLRQREAKFKLGWAKERIKTHPVLVLKLLPNIIWKEFICSTNGVKALKQWANGK